MFMVGSDLDDNAKASYMMSEIREKVLRMKDEGKDVSNMDDILIFKDSDLITEMPVSESIDYILKNWNIENSYNITSHRKVIGPVLVYGRKLVNGEINRNVGPIISRQNDLNHVIAGALQGHNDTINDLSLRLSKLETDYERIERTVPKVERVLNTQNHIVQYIGDINQRLDQIMATLNLSTECVNAKAFADAFGGTEENIKDLYSMFIGYYI
jgi:O-antigen chain-terminating methyltransferase